MGEAVQRRPVARTGRWTGDEDAVLRWAWRDKTLAWVAYRLGRSEHSVVMRARRLKLGPPSAGTMTLRAFCRAHGYTTTRVLWAIEMRGIAVARVKRSDPRQSTNGNRYALTPEQQESLLSLLRAHGKVVHRARRVGAWGEGKKPPHCYACGGTRRPHYARGKCKPCYVAEHKWMRRRRQGKARRARPAQVNSS